MKSAVADVTAFHVALDQAINAPLGTDTKLRLKLIREEVRELRDALAEGDRVAVADALADIAYVVVGSAVTWGIPLAEVFAEVHRSNMTKRGGEKRGDGKILKPAWYEPPDIAGVLKREKSRKRIRRAPHCKCCGNSLVGVKLIKDDVYARLCPERDGDMCELAGWVSK